MKPSLRLSNGARDAEVESVVFSVFQTGLLANGGVESISQIIKGLGAGKACVITQMDGAFAQSCRAEGVLVRIFELPYAMSSAAISRNVLDMFRRVVWLARSNVEAFKMVSERRAHILHCNDMPALWHTALGGRAAGARVVLSIRGTGVKETRWHRIKWRLVRWLSNTQVVLSDEMKTYWSRRLYPNAVVPPDMHAIYSIVDLSKFAPPSEKERRSFRAARGIPEGGVALGCVGAVSEAKNQFELVRAFADLASLRHDVRLYCVGDFGIGDKYAQACAQLVLERGLAKQVFFKGFDSNIADWYRAFDVTLVASRSEGLARCMIESLACGTPVVSTPVCSAGEILAGGGGTVVDEHDCRLLLQAAFTLIENPERVAIERESGRRSAEARFSAARVLAQYQHVYGSARTTR